MNKKPVIDVRTLVARLSEEGAALREREIIAPLLPGGQIRTRLNGLVYEFKPQGKLVGWGCFRPVSETEAEVVGEALPWQRSAYLELFPALKVILLWPLTASDNQPDSKNRKSKIENRKSGIWWALPYNESDARQRFGLVGTEPLPVFLCDPTGGAERFERVIARVDGRTLWFDGPDYSADPQQAERLRELASAEDVSAEERLPGLAASQRLALLYWQIHQLEQAEAAEVRELALVLAQEEAETRAATQAEAERQQRRNLAEQRRRIEHRKARSRLEERLRHALQKADANLLSFTETTNPDGSPGALVVEWSLRGQTHSYRSLVEPGLSVVSSGICLSGRDNDFDLTSLVNVMTDRSNGAPRPAPPPPQRRQERQRQRREERRSNRR